MHTPPGLSTRYISANTRSGCSDKLQHPLQSPPSNTSHSNRHPLPPGNLTTNGKAILCLEIVRWLISAAIRACVAVVGMLHLQAPLSTALPVPPYERTMAKHGPWLTSFAPDCLDLGVSGIKGYLHVQGPHTCCRYWTLTQHNTASIERSGSAQPSGSAFRSRTKNESSRLLRASCIPCMQPATQHLHF